MNARTWLATILFLIPAALAAGPPNPLPAASVTRKALDNGLTVIVRADPHAPLAVADLWVAAGAVDDGGTGAAHALEHMVFFGGDGVPAGRADARVEAAGGTLYATTFPDATHYWTALPAARLPDALAALADIMRPPAVEAPAWERERRVMLEEITRDAGNLAADARRALLGRLYGAPFGVPVAGTPARLERLEPDDIRDFHRARYRPDRMALVVAGPVDADSVLSLARRTLGALPKAAGDPPARPAVRTATRWTEVEADDGARVVVGFGWPVNEADGPALDVVAGILRGRLEASLGARARRVEVSQPWQRAGALLALVEGAESDRAAIRAAMARECAALPEGLTADAVAAAVRERQWGWWLENERPAAQARALGLSFAVGDPDGAVREHESLAGVTLESARAAALLLKVPAR